MKHGKLSRETRKYDINAYYISEVKRIANMRINGEDLKNTIDNLTNTIYKYGYNITKEQVIKDIQNEMDNLESNETKGMHR